jgi:hypothetical protein
MVKPIEAEFVSVIWLDAWKMATDEPDIADSHKPARMETRGWLLQYDDVGASLADERSLDDDPAYRGRTFIPAGMIESVQPYPPKRKRHAKASAPAPSAA